MTFSSCSTIPFSIECCVAKQKSVFDQFGRIIGNGQWTMTEYEWQH